MKEAQAHMIHDSIGYRNTVDIFGFWDRFKKVFHPVPYSPLYLKTSWLQKQCKFIGGLEKIFSC